MDNELNPIENTRTDQSYNILHTFLLFIAVMIIFGGVQLFAFIGLTIAFITPEEGASIEGLIDGDLLAASLLLSAIAGLITIGFFLTLRRLDIKSYLAFRGFSVFSLLTWSAVYILYLVLLYTFKDYFESDVELITDIMSSAEYLPLLIISVVFVGPFFEEVMFRGFLFKGFNRKPLGPTGAILLTALMFSLLHALQYGPMYLIAIFVGGIIMGAARYHSGSIWPPFILHAVHNFLSLLFMLE